MLLYHLIVPLLHLISPGYLFAYSEKKIAITVAIRDYFKRNRTLTSAKLMHPGDGWVQLSFGLNTTGGGTECVDGSESPEVDCGDLGPQPGHICIQVCLPTPTSFGIYSIFQR